MTTSVPAGWVTVRLDEVVDVCDYLREPVNAKDRSGRVGSFPYYGATGQVGWIDGYRQDGEYVLLGEDGAPFFDPNRSKAYLVSGKCWVNNHAHVLRGRDQVCDNRYLMHSLNAANYRGFANGTTRLKLTQEAMRRLPLRLAPYREQLRITEKLEELLTDLDAAVVALRRTHESLKRYRAAVLKNAVEGKLTAEWRRSNPEVESAAALLARVLKRRRNNWEKVQLANYAAQGKPPPSAWDRKYPEPAEPDCTDLPILPDTWRWVSLDAICQVGGGLTKGQRRRDGAVTRDVPYLRVANVQRGYLDLAIMKTIPATETDIDELRLQPGDVLFNEGGDRDKLGRGWIWSGEIKDCIHQNHVFRARPVIPDLESKLISFHGNTFGQKWFQRSGKQSVNLASINLTTLRCFPVPLPPVAEQVAIVQEAERRLSVISKVETEIKRGLERAAQLRQAILKRAFDGKLVPQKSKEEPASVLLERGRATRTENTPAREEIGTRKPAKAQSARPAPKNWRAQTSG